MPASAPCVGAVLAAFGDALAKPRDLLFDRLDLAPRHRLVELGADLDQFAAQRVDRFLHARPAQGFDLVGDAAELIFQAGNVLRRQRRTRRLLCRGGRGSGNGSGRCRRHGGRRHLLRGLRHRRRLLRHRRLLLRLRLRPRGRRRRLAIERALARGNLGHRALERRRQLHVWRRRLRSVVGAGSGGCAARAPRRVSRRACARQLLDAARKIVQPLIDAGEVFAMGGAAALRVRWQIRLGGFAEDHGVEPISQRHAGAARRLHCVCAGPRPDPLRHASERQISFARTTLQREAAQARSAPWRRHALTIGWIRARSAVLGPRLFAVRGKQVVKEWGEALILVGLAARPRLTKG